MRLGAVNLAWASKDLIELDVFLQATLTLVRSIRLYQSATSQVSIRDVVTQIQYFHRCLIPPRLSVIYPYICIRNRRAKSKDILGI